MIRIILYCARQDIELRGHHNEKLQIINIDNGQDSSSKCNEIELIHNQNQGMIKLYIFMKLILIISCKIFHTYKS